MLVPGIGVAKLDWFPTCPGPYMIVVFWPGPNPPAPPNQIKDMLTKRRVFIQ